MENRQFSNEYRTVDVTVNDYVDPSGRSFLVRGEGAGNIAIENPTDSSKEIFTIEGPYTLEYVTSKIFKDGTTVTNLKIALT